MAKSANQKYKLIYLAKIMEEKTDENHFLTMPQILEELDKYEVSAERKSIYNDLADLEKLGLEVEGVREGKYTYYHVVDRKFELAELKLLVDSIQASKFITAKKSRQLIAKLETLCSGYEAGQLSRQVYVNDRIKNMNESIYYNVDAIHNAIADDKMITFRYFNWNKNKEAEFKHDGRYYRISPWALLWEADNYYLVGFDAEADSIKHYRVDKMLNIAEVDEKRKGKEAFDSSKMSLYASKNFSMFGGSEKYVNVMLSNRMCGVFVDRFGKDITFVPIDDEHVTVRLNVALSEHFLSWIFALGDEVKITGPEDVMQELNAFLDRLNRQYGRLNG